MGTDALFILTEITTSAIGSTANGLVMVALSTSLAEFTKDNGNTANSWENEKNTDGVANISDSSLSQFCEKLT